MRQDISQFVPFTLCVAEKWLWRFGDFTNYSLKSKIDRGIMENNESGFKDEKIGRILFHISPI